MEFILKRRDSLAFFFYLMTQRQHIGKGKAIPLQAWTGPNGSRRMRLTGFKTIGT
jgi:hypothetical protein